MLVWPSSKSVFELDSSILWQNSYNSIIMKQDQEKVINPAVLIFSHKQKQVVEKSIENNKIVNIDVCISTICHIVFFVNGHECTCKFPSCCLTQNPPSYLTYGYYFIHMGPWPKNAW